MPTSIEVDKSRGASAPTKAAEASRKTIVLLSDTLVDPLVRILEELPEQPALRAIAAPYAQVYQALMDPRHEAWQTKPDYLLLWTTPMLTLPAFQQVLRFNTGATDTVMKEAGEFADLVIQAASR